MQDQRPNRQIPLGLIAGLSVLVLSAGSAVAWWTVTNHSQSAPSPAAQKASAPDDSEKSAPAIAPSPAAPATIQPPSSQSATDTGQKRPEVYWLKPTTNSVKLTPVPVKSPTVVASNPVPALQSTLNQLLAGTSKPADSSTTIPAGTKLRAVTVQKDGIHVDLSKEFTTGGGAASMTGRVGQVLYSVTSLQADQPVWISVEGKPLETLGGEGLVLEQPLTRERFKQDFPQE